jgi:GT2 family glycosyltransferase
MEPVTVVVPTIGRVGLLERCLQSILDCDPPAAEVVVNDQSGGADVAALCERLGVRRLADDGRGIARATNALLRAATYDVVLRTDDDCTVAPDWVGVAAARMRERPDGLVTGRVLPAGVPDATPSTMPSTEPVDHTGGRPRFVLYSGNMAVNRHRALDLGGFDERPSLVPADDNDLSWRWIDAGLPFRFEPAMVVWHHDWRSPSQLQRQYRAYARAQGALYAKHLHAGDRRMRALVKNDLQLGLRAVRDPSRWRGPDEQRALLVGIPLGLVRGWRDAWRIDRRGRG